MDFEDIKDSDSLMSSEKPTEDCINQTFLKLEKIDNNIKNVTRKLVEISDGEIKIDISDLNLKANAFFSSYNKIINYLEQFLKGTNQNNFDLVSIIKNRLEIAIDQNKLTKSSYRKNLLKATSCISESKRSELFNDDSSSVLRKRGNKINNELKQSFQINDTLAQLNSTMGNALFTSSATLNNINSQNETMLKTKAEADNQTNYIEDGSRLITKYGSRERTDKILIWLGVVTFFMTCVYILLKRIFGFFL